MKLLIVLNYYAPHLSGLSEYARHFAEDLAKIHQVTVLTGLHDPGLPRTESIQGVRVIRTRPWIRLHRGYVSPGLLTEFRRLAREADGVHLHLPMLEAALLAHWTPKRTPLWLTYHCDMAATGGILDRLATSAVRISAKSTIRRASRVLVTSLDYAQGSPVLSEHLEKCVEIFPPAQVPPLPSGLDIEAARLKRKDTRSFRIGFLGRFAAEKGLGVLLAAIPEVVSRHPQAKFVLAGESQSVLGGSVIRELARILEINRVHVEMPGRLSRIQWGEFFASLDLLVLPSLNSTEAFGMVQVEAMRAGVPVIATDLRGVRVPIRLTSAGELIPAGDSGACARAILRWLEPERGFQKRIGTKEIARRAEIFSNEKSFLKMRELITQEVAGSLGAQRNQTP